MEIPAHLLPHAVPGLAVPEDELLRDALLRLDHRADLYKQRMERGGTLAGCDESGMPLDPNHHWA